MRVTFMGQTQITFLGSTTETWKPFLDMRPQVNMCKVHIQPVITQLMQDRTVQFIKIVVRSATKQQ